LNWRRIVALALNAAAWIVIILLIRRFWPHGR
jgi:hypothetical protein